MPYLSVKEWKVIAVPALLPYLSKPGKSFGERKRLFYELAPEEARKLMVRSAAQNDWASVAEWTSVLPDNSKPSNVIDSHIAQALEKRPRNAFVRFNLDQALLQIGGPALIAPVYRILKSQSCLGDPALWAFLLKKEGALAEERLVRRYHRARLNSICEADLQLQRIWLDSFAQYWSPQIEAIVVSQLGKTDSLVAGAAKLLENFGSADSENAIWERLERWHKFPTPLPQHSSETTQTPHDLEYALLSAVVNGNNWMPTAVEIGRLHHLCVYFCEYFNEASSAEQLQVISIGEQTGGKVRFVTSFKSMNFEELKKWMRRFPAGKKIVFTRWPMYYALDLAEVDREYPYLVQLVHSFNLQIVNVLPYDEYGRCTDERSASEKSVF